MNKHSFGQVVYWLSQAGDVKTANSGIVGKIIKNGSTYSYIVSDGVDKVEVLESNLSDTEGVVLDALNSEV